MVVEGFVKRLHQTGHGSWVPAMAVAVAAVLPLLAPEVWSGFRLAQSDPVLSVIAPTEQPLSVRSPIGIWAMGLVLAWFGLTYRHRSVMLWEVGLVLLGGVAILARAGNAWLEAAAMVLPLARQVRFAGVGPLVGAPVAVICVGAALAALALTRPPALPVAAREAATAAAARGRVIADWRWAGTLQQRLGDHRQVLASGGLASEAPDFWLDYLRIAQGHERWAEALRRLDVDLVVLESSDQQHQTAALVRGSDEWRVLFDADGALVAERTGA